MVDAFDAVGGTGLGEAGGVGDEDAAFDEVVEELRELLGSTVANHMIADVPVGVLLSGGMDSSAVLNFAVQQTGKKINTFTVGFSGQGVLPNEWDPVS